MTHPTVANAVDPSVLYEVRRNGLVQVEGASYDYTRTDQTFTMIPVLGVTDDATITYRSP